MSRSPDRTKLLALAALWQTVERADAAPSKLGPETRLAMAVLESLGAGREDLVRLWRHLRDPMETAASDHLRKIVRRSWGDSMMRTICRSVGVRVDDPEVERAIRGYGQDRAQG
jgi:hypothetical protein